MSCRCIPQLCMIYICTCSLSGLINVLWNCSSDLASSSLFLIPSDLGSTLPQSLRCNATMLHYQVAYLQASATPGDGEDGNCP